MASCSDAVDLWRTRRKCVSENREANVTAWTEQLGATLRELGLTTDDLEEYLDDDDLRTWMEGEYDNFQEAPSPLDLPR